VAHEYNIPVVADDWRDVVSRADVDLVSIVTPPATHMEMTLAALDAGKAVLCEKPMAMTAAQADRMRRRAAETGSFAHINHELRFLAGRRKMREMIAQGDIGPVHHVKILFRMDSRATPDQSWNWWSDTGQGGGILGAVGSHAIDLLRWTLNGEVSQVFCALATHIAERLDVETGARRPVTADDEATLLLRFADNELMTGATGAVSLSAVESGRYEHRMEVFGARGALLVEDTGALWRARTGGREWTPVEVENVAPAPGISDSGWARGWTVFACAIIEALREGRRQVEGAATFDDGYRTQLVLDAARRAHETGCWVAPEGE
jgi:predicted dehydrogenase